MGVTKGQVSHGRLDDPTLDAGECDVVLCLEVLEHIPEDSEHVALENLGRHTSRALVVSWAPPGIPGDGHVNLKEPQESRMLIEQSTGLIQDEILTSKARSRAQIEWIS